MPCSVAFLVLQRNQLQGPVACCEVRHCLAAAWPDRPAWCLTSAEVLCRHRPRLHALVTRCTCERLAPPHSSAANDGSDRERSAVPAWRCNREGRNAASAQHPYWVHSPGLLDSSRPGLLLQHSASSAARLPRQQRRWADAAHVRQQRQCVCRRLGCSSWWRAGRGSCFRGGGAAAAPPAAAAASGSASAVQLGWRAGMPAAPGTCSPASAAIRQPDRASHRLQLPKHRAAQVPSNWDAELGCLLPQATASWHQHYGGPTECLVGSSSPSSSSGRSSRSGGAAGSQDGSRERLGTHSSWRLHSRSLQLKPDDFQILLDKAGRPDLLGAGATAKVSLSRG